MWATPRKHHFIAADKSVLISPCWLRLRGRGTDMGKRKGSEGTDTVKELSAEEVLDIQTQFRAALEANDVEKIAYALYAHSEHVGGPKQHVDLVGMGNGFPASDNSDDFSSVEIEENPMRPYFTQANKVMDTWKYSLVTGDSIDVFRENELVWYTAKITKKDGDLINLHYQGWAAKYDDNGISFSACQMYPCGTAVKQKKKPVAKKTKAVHYEIVKVNVEEELASAAAAAAAGATDRKGRRDRAARASLEEVKTSDKKPSSKRKKTKEEEDLEDSLRREWVCCVCSQLEAPDESDLILCDGLCKRSFHLMCLNLSEEESAKLLADDSEWWCDECKAGRHTCFLCGDEGEDHEDVIMCCQSNCGKFYHYNCITTQSGHYSLKKKQKPVLAVMTSSSSSASSLNATEVIAEDCSSSSSSSLAKENTIAMASPRRVIKAPARYREEDSGTPTSNIATSASVPTKKKNKTEEGFAQFELKCPYHFCDTCHNLYGPDKPPAYGHHSHDKLHKCFRCPRSFHHKCIPPSSRYNAHALLCPNHPNEILPTFEPILKTVQTQGDNGENSACMGTFNFLWDQMQLPLRPPRMDKLADIGHFRLSSGIEAEISSHPPTFKLIWTNDYDALNKTEEEEDYPEGVIGPKVQVPLHFSDEVCECIEKCDENCLNRISKIECCEKNTIKKESICNVGKGCGNRQFTNREYVKVQPFQEYGMGWGLKAKEFVSAGTLVIEYIGEVITEAQMNRRMILQSQLTPHDHDFYIMELSNGLFVDGKRKGNLSRFINHACDPNCELVRWVVKGRTRIGIFAIKDISPDEPLSYDYQFDTQEADTFRCGCGAAKCRGTMAPTKKVVSKASLSKKELKRLIAAARKRENKVSLTEEEWKRSETGKFLPGEGILEMKNGAPKNSFRLAREFKLFLPRNTNHTENITDRRKRMWAKSGSVVDGGIALSSSSSESFSGSGCGVMSISSR